MSAAERTVVVVIGGDPPDPRVLDEVPLGATVIAADSGLDHALALGLRVDRVVGDLDSVSAAALAQAEASGVPVDRHPPAKDATDTELALDLALELCHGDGRVLVVSGGGDRLDHLLGTIAVLARPSSVPVEAWIGDTRLVVVDADRPLSLDLPDGALVGLVPVGGDAHGVRTTGLRWALADETLVALASRGLSNEVVSSPVTVHLSGGALVAVVPASLGGTPT